MLRSKQAVATKKKESLMKTIHTCRFALLRKKAAGDTEDDALKVEGRVLDQAEKLLCRAKLQE
eukprot:5991413-Amphidinium_carterae.1